MDERKFEEKEILKSLNVMRDALLNLEQIHSDVQNDIAAKLHLIQYLLLLKEKKQSIITAPKI